MNPREAQKYGQYRQKEERRMDMRKARLENFPAEMKAAHSLLSAKDDLAKARREWISFSRKNGMDKPLDKKKENALFKRVQAAEAKVERLKKASRNTRQKNVARQTAYKKGGYVKCGASNPPSKKR